MKYPNKMSGLQGWALLEETNALGVVSATVVAPCPACRLKTSACFRTCNLILFELALKVTVGGGVQSPVLHE